MLTDGQRTDRRSDDRKRNASAAYCWQRHKRHIDNYASYRPSLARSTSSTGVRDKQTINSPAFPRVVRPTSADCDLRRTIFATFQSKTAGY